MNAINAAAVSKRGSAFMMKPSPNAPHVTGNHTVSSPLERLFKRQWILCHRYTQTKDIENIGKPDKETAKNNSTFRPA
jgi:hypothetical protein